MKVLTIFRIRDTISNIIGKDKRKLKITDDNDL